MKKFFFKNTPVLIITACLIFLADISPCLSQKTEYSIGPSDVLSLIVYAGGEKQIQADMTVSSQGMVNVPFIGPLKAGGLTVPELESEIIAPLARDYFVNPEVNIIIKEYHSLRFYISGAVRTSGQYEMTAVTSLMELIAKSGGVTADCGNVAYVLRTPSPANEPNSKAGGPLFSSAEPIKVDLKSLLDKGDMSHNLILKAGDVIYIPHDQAIDLGESKIYVEGEVMKPGVFDYQTGITALNACIMAGGFGKYSAPNRARVIRQQGDKQSVLEIDLNRVKKGEILDIELQPGDRVHIPESWL
ncbi:MAG: polysaccharide biosynthesis/export family protein [Deltaproteobacteria bacterium]|nr:polysaccharide biosynthesis/export family protein [Deltaproteobacteria bacterium]